MIDTFYAALVGFNEAPRDLTESRALQQRVDRKYVLPMDLLPALLAELHADYHIVMSAGQAIARYDTRYFDTEERQLYHDHRRGRRPRYKVRVRHHVDRRRTFLEVKSKAQSDRTVKARVELPFGQNELDAEARRFIDEQCPIDAGSLLPCVSVSFLRVTLIGIALLERVTLDWELQFRNRGRCARVPGVVIAEIKQARYSNVHGAARALRVLNIREQMLSKYCLGTARLMPVRMNTFKPAFRTLERLLQCQNC